MSRHTLVAAEHIPSRHQHRELSKAFARRRSNDQRDGRACTPIRRTRLRRLAYRHHRAIFLQSPGALAAPYRQPVKSYRSSVERDLTLDGVSGRLQRVILSQDLRWDERSNVLDTSVDETADGALKCRHRRFKLFETKKKETPLNRSASVQSGLRTVPKRDRRDSRECNYSEKVYKVMVAQEGYKI